MKLLLEYIEDFSFEDQMYWCIQNSKSEKIEIFWKRQNSGPAIWYTQINGQISQHFTAQNFEQHLTHVDGDINQFNEQIKTTILTMACFASNLLNHAKALLGEDTVERAIIDHNDFSKKLLEVISNNVQSVKKRSLKIIHRKEYN